MSTRDWQGNFRFLREKLPKTEVETSWGRFSGVTDWRPSFGGALFESQQVTVVDARTHLPGGKDAWSLDEHGFCYIARPAYDFEEHAQQDRKRVDAEFGPKVVEAVRLAAGAKRAFWMSHQRRAEEGARIAGQDADGYVLGFGHSDYGPDFERQLRTVLTARYGVLPHEAQTCGLCLVNMWAPVQRPAYQNPLAYLDSSSIEMPTHTTKYLLPSEVDTGYGYQKEALGQEKHPRPVNERVPVAAKDAPALAPLYSPQHRWVYLPDMTEDEAVIFKQYDFRKSSTSKATFHQAFPDPFHSSWADCPGRRSIECRVVLTYDTEILPAKL
jgi:hypothetical protein